MPVRDILLITIAGGGVFMDVLQEKVDNRLICLGFGTGLIFWIFHSGPKGIPDFLTGFLFPLFCLLPLHYFGMIGGGDVKLLSVLGGILGYPEVLKLLYFTFLTGGILSLAFLLLCGSLKERISYFIAYFSGYRTEDNGKNYRKKGPNPENYHFTVPIFTGIILFVGGCY